MFACFYLLAQDDLSYVQDGSKVEAIALIDYDEVRQEVSNIFADKAAEVQSLVAKLQKTQRAAEQALDKFVSFARVVLVCRVNHAPRSCRYEKTCAE